MPRGRLTTVPQRSGQIGQEHGAARAHRPFEHITNRTRRTILDQQSNMPIESKTGEIWITRKIFHLNLILYCMRSPAWTPASWYVEWGELYSGNSSEPPATTRHISKSLRPERHVGLSLVTDSQLDSRLKVAEVQRDSYHRNAVVIDNGKAGNPER